MANEYASMISYGALKQMQKDDDGSKPIVQLLDLKPVKENRLRAYLWDGVEEFSYGMISSQAVPQVEDKLKPFCLLRVNNYSVTVTKDRPIVIIMSCEVVAEARDVKEKVTFTGRQRKEKAGNNQTITTGTAGLKTPPKTNQRPTMISGTPKTPSGSAVMSIAALNPYQTRVTIRGRVTSKGDIRTWSKASGQGKLFSFVIYDESGEIRVTAFNEQVDQFYERIQPKQVYYISGFQCKAANKTFRANNNEYELTLGKFSNVELCTEDCADVPQMNYEFVKIAEIEDCPTDKLIDVCAVVKSFAEPQTFNRRTDGRPITKREVILVDDSSKAITLTLWNDSAITFQGENNPILLVTKARISEFNGSVSITTGQASALELNPDLNRGNELKLWWRADGSKSEFESIRGSGGGTEYVQEWMDFELMARKGETFDVSDKPIYVWNRVTITMFNKDNALYKACSSDNCMKKVQDLGEGRYRCEKCERESDRFNWRMLLKIVVSDATKQFWATAFNEKAEQILGVTAKTLGEYLECDSDMLDKTFADAMFKEFHMKLRGKMEVFQEERRFRLAVVDAKEVKIIEDCKHLLKEIEALGKLL
ncbi:replication protein A 70 kDa DNA-binding subunit-like [Tropilaelaps mercedesae]|uniref:Replication protein A subunit n=1 Tax=Tropilaelaps mercedesae TaxID=418985 RepID=A0A1V9XZB1_9ACAR|nr:replication protein A 70 kDa DNA-binding subunit-like [Tropilaelaps mercedesae]